jgi:hypothetical protein
VSAIVPIQGLPPLVDLDTMPLVRLLVAAFGLVCALTDSRLETLTDKKVASSRMAVELI